MAVATGISTARPQRSTQRLQALGRVAIGIRLRRIGIDDEVDLALKIVDDRKLFGQQQLDVGNGRERFAHRRRRCRETVLDVAHRVIGEIAGEAAAKSRQPGDRSGTVPTQECGDEVERISFVALGDNTAGRDFDGAARGRRYGPLPEVR